MYKKTLLSALAGAVCAGIGIAVCSILKDRLDVVVVNDDEDADEAYDDMDDEDGCDFDCDTCEYREECTYLDTDEEIMEKLDEVAATVSDLKKCLLKNGEEEAEEAEDAGAEPEEESVEDSQAETLSEE